VQALLKIKDFSKAKELFTANKPILEQIPYPEELSDTYEEILAGLGQKEHSLDRGRYYYHRYMIERKRPLLLKALLRKDEKAIKLINTKNYRRVLPKRFYRKLAPVFEKKNPYLAIRLYSRLKMSSKIGNIFFRLKKYRRALRYLPKNSVKAAIARVAVKKPTNRDIDVSWKNLDKSYKHLMNWYFHTQNMESVYELLRKDYHPGYLRSFILHFFKKKEYTPAIAFLAKIADMDIPFAEKTMAGYWTGYLLFVENKIPDSVPYLKAIAERYPFSYYGWQAFQLLTDRRGIIENWERTYRKNLKLQKNYLNELNIRKFPDSARTALFFLKINESGKGFKLLRNTVGENLEPYYLSLLKFYKSLGRNDMTVHFANRIYDRISKSTESRIFYSNLFKELFPLDYAHILDKASEKFSIPADVLTALIRQESCFYPSAVSWVGAQGLMQLMPSTGRPILKRLSREKVITNKNIFDPHTNIMTGSYYLNWLFGRVYRDYPSPYRLILSIASYNAGPGRIKRLYNSMDYKINPSHFVENIYLNETRHYVKKVLLYREIYHYLHGQPKTPDQEEDQKVAGKF
jgi:tetratricopeptide (TPR) repeat protein